MNAVNSLTRTPNPQALAQTPERGPLCLLAACALCTQNALIAQHSEVFDYPLDEYDDEHPPKALSLAALQLHRRINAMLAALRLYDAVLHDAVVIRDHPDLPF